MSNITEVPMDFIENSIKIGIKISESSDNCEKKYVNDFDIKGLTNIYFVGRGLCLDIKDKSGNPSVITISWDSESVGYFKGGPRKLLSLKSLRNLRKLMDLNGIKYSNKEIV